MATRKNAVWHAEQVPLLVAAIEQRGKATAALPVRQGGPRGVQEMRPSTVYAALALELELKPERVRQEIIKYRGGLRLPRPQKVVDMVDAASRLGWLDARASGTGAEQLVQWCREECSRQAANLEQRRQRRLAAAVREMVGSAFDAAEVGERDDEAGTALLAELLDLIADVALEELSSRQRHWDANSSKTIRSAGSRLQKKLLAAATRVAGEWHVQQATEVSDRAAHVEEQQRLELAHAMLGRAEALGATQLGERALRQGVGKSQLERILKGIREGLPLSEGDARQARALLGGFRPVSDWTKRPR